MFQCFPDADVVVILADMDDDALGTPRPKIPEKKGKPSPDDIHDAGDGVRWLSYGELAEARRISKASATRLAFRRRWARRIGNDGTARVAVPVEELAEKPAPDEDGIPDDIHDDIDGQSHAVMALQTAIEALREQLGRANSEKDDLRNQRDRAQEAEDRARSELQSAREVISRQEDRIFELEGLLTAPAKNSELPESVLAAISQDLESEGQPPWVEEVWGAYDSNDQSAAADSAHEAERVWDRISELETRLAEQKVAQTALEEKVCESAGTDQRPGAGEGAAAVEQSTPEKRQQPWWRRLLRRDERHEPRS